MKVKKRREWELEAAARTWDDRVPSGVVKGGNGTGPFFCRVDRDRVGGGVGGDRGRVGRRRVRDLIRNRVQNLIRNQVRVTTLELLQPPLQTLSVLFRIVPPDDPSEYLMELGPRLGLYIDPVQSELFRRLRVHVPLQNLRLRMSRTVRRGLCRFVGRWVVLEEVIVIRGCQRTIEDVCRHRSGGVCSVFELGCPGGGRLSFAEVIKKLTKNPL